MNGNTILHKYFNDTISLDDDYSRDELLALSEIETFTTNDLHYVIMDYSDSDFYKKLRDHKDCTEKFNLLCKLMSPSLDDISYKNIDIFISDLACSANESKLFSKHVKLKDIIINNIGHKRYIFETKLPMNGYGYLCQQDWLQYSHEHDNYFVQYIGHPPFYYGKSYLVISDSGWSKVIKCIYDRSRGGISIDNPIPQSISGMTVYQFDTYDEALQANEMFNVDNMSFYKKYGWNKHHS